MSLKELQDNVLADAALHLPDVVYDINSNEHSARFTTLPLSELIDEEEPDVAGLAITRDRETPEQTSSHNYMFTRWSRQQLLSLMGTKEKWFGSVSLGRQVEELDARRHVLGGYRIRTMKAVDEGFPVRLVRGLVSGQYSEIKNTDIMEAVIREAGENSMVLRNHSGLSDRAFYSYIISQQPITIPGTSFFAYPGVLVKNSEVGYTSLWVIPILVTKRFDAPIIIEGKERFRRIHRGVPNLPQIFQTAFAKSALVWADLATKIPALASKSYGNEQDAVTALQRMLVGAKASGAFVQDCVQTYKAVTRNHTALDIFEAILEVCGKQVDRDETYTAGAIAGAVLYRLVF